MAYCIQLFITFFLSIINDATKNKIGQFFLFFSVTLLFIMSALRVNIGTDYVNYVYLYEQITSSFYVYDFKVEPGYYIVSLISNSLFDKPQAMFAIMALITVAPCFVLAKRTSATVITIVFLSTIFLSSLSLVRQMAAISILLLASAYLIDNRIKKSLICVFAACCFHYSSLIFIVFIIFRKYKIGVFQGVAAVAAFWFAMNILQIPQLILSSDLIQGTKYGVYEKSLFNQETELGSGLGVLLKLSPILWTLIFIYLHGMHKKEWKDTGARFVIAANYAFVLATILSLSVRIFNRVSDIMIFVPVICGYYMYKSLPANRKIYFSCFLLLNVGWYLATAFKSYSSLGYGLGITPYEWLIN